MKSGKIVFPLIIFSIFNFQTSIAATTNVSGFLTAGTTYSDNETPYLRSGITDDQPTFDQDTVLGIQLDSVLDPTTRLSAQLIASNKEGNDFDVNAEWLYVSKNIGSYTTARMGRLRIPIHLYSEQLFVGASYVWLRPPQEVYNLLADISNFTGADVRFTLDMDVGSAYLQLYAGNVNDKPLNILGQKADISTDQLFGVVGRFDTDDLSLFLSYSRLDGLIESSFDVIVPAPGPPPNLAIVNVPLNIESNSEVVTLGFKYAIGNFEMFGEHAERISDDAGDTTGWYGTLAYNMNSWTPYLTLGQMDTGTVDPTSQLAGLVLLQGLPIQSLQQDSESITFGIRKSLSPKVSLNAEVHKGEARHGAKGLFISYIPSATSVTPEQAEPEVLLFSIAVNALF